MSALINALTTVRWFYNVCSSQSVQLELVVKAVQSVLDDNQNRARNSECPATYKDCMDILSTVCNDAGYPV